MNSDSREKLRNSVNSLRALGFFQKDVELTDEELALKFERELTWNDKRPEAEYDPHTSSTAEPALTLRDEHRTWWRDLEMDVCSGTERYVRTLNEWAQISRGKFQPTNIEETWLTNEGPIHVNFTHLDRHFEFQPTYLGDYLDIITLLNLVNSIIAKHNLRYETLDTGDQTAFVLALTSEEKRVLEDEHNWPFNTHQLTYKVNHNMITTIFDHIKAIFHGK